MDAAPDGQGWFHGYVGQLTWILPLIGLEAFREGSVFWGVTLFVLGAVNAYGVHRWPQNKEKLQLWRRHSPMVSTAVVATICALVGGFAWWFLAGKKTAATASSTMFVTVEDVGPFGNTFGMGQKPVFHPKFLNSGPVPLDGVRVNVTLQILEKLPGKPWPFVSLNDERLPRLPARGASLRQVERIGDELTQKLVDALTHRTLYYFVFVRIYDESGNSQHSDSCFVFNPDRGRTGTYTGDANWIFDQCVL